jgi:hypothetical protein|tara:strand:- start:2137 stop:2388 length:252 start_codon:yes stop_codon:yes gene_type:complete
MLKHTIKTLFGNLAPVHSKYVFDAILKEKDLEIVYKDQSMIIPYDRLDKPKKMIYVTDKFTGEKKHLYYFDWIPVDPNQGRLL